MRDEAPVGRGYGGVSQHARGKHYEDQDGGQAPGNHVIQGHQLLRQVDATFCHGHVEIDPEYERPKKRH